MLRLVLQSAILSGGTLARCGPLLTLPRQHIISGSSDHTIRIWDAETGALVRDPLKGHTDSVRSVAYSHDGQHIISGSDDSTIQIWDAETGAPVGDPLEGHTDPVRSVAYSPDGRRIISGSKDRTIRIWDAESGAPVGGPLEGHTDWVHSVSSFPDRRHIISRSDDSTIITWDDEAHTAAGKPLWEHTSSVQSIAHSSDRKHLISGSYGNIIRVLDASPHPSIRSSNCNPTHPSFWAKPDKDGWVKDSEGGLLYWVPHDCRKRVHSPAIMTIPLTFRKGTVSLDFGDFAFGTSWSQIFKSAPL